MILPDVNILIYAFRSDTPQHEPYAAWLEGMAQRGSGLALCDAVVAGFLRVVTHPHVISPPTPMSQALLFTRWLFEVPGTNWLTPERSVWETFDRIAVADPGVRGNLVPDAYLAALCLAHGATIATADRDFARFDGLHRIDPAA